MALFDLCQGTLPKEERQKYFFRQKTIGSFYISSRFMPWFSGVSHFFEFDNFIIFIL